MWYSDDERCFGSCQVLFVEVKQLSQVHGLKLLVEHLLVNRDHHNRGASKEVEVLLLLI